MCIYIFGKLQNHKSAGENLISEAYDYFTYCNYTSGDDNREDDQF